MEPVMTLAAQTLLIDVRHIDLHPDRPRRRIDRDGLDALAQSIEQHGLLQPILVRQTGPNRYELLAGERRLLAHKDLGRPGIAALLATGSPTELSLVENLHRESLLGHVYRVSFEEGNKAWTCLFQVASSAYPKSLQKVAWNKYGSVTWGLEIPLMASVG